MSSVQEQEQTGNNLTSDNKNSDPTDATSKNEIDDVVSFSLCSLCAIRLNNLYPEQFHESFRISYIQQMVEHFELPVKVVQTCREFLEDDEFTFLSAIKQQYRHRLFRIIEELVLLSIKSGSYDARGHYLIIDVAELLGMPRELVEIHCESIYGLMLKMQQVAIDEEKNKKQDRDREKRESRNKLKKYIMIGLASLGGGAVIGVTGGLAAPIVASAFAGVLGAGSVVMSSMAAGVVGSIFGVAGAGLTASKMNKRIGDLEEFQFLSLSPENDQTSLTITIAISGLISNEGAEEFAKPWKSLSHTREQYCLCYESKYLLELSAAMDYLLSFVVSYATQEALKYTFLASVMSAIAWPAALISIANIIDNPWDVCLKRSAQAGRHLADVLLSRQQGQRPASLIGFNLGARVIFFCLQELCERENSEGIIGDVVLLGAPVSASVDQWKHLSRVVSGRIVNGYSSSDWLLKFLYRTSSAAIHVAGLQEIQWKDRRMKNVDLTPIVSSHMDYYKKLSEILDYVNIRTVVKFEDDLALANKAAPLKGVVGNSNSRCDGSKALASESPSSNSLVTDSGIERTISNATDISTSSNAPTAAAAAHATITLTTTNNPNDANELPADRLSPNIEVDVVTCSSSSSSSAAAASSRLTNLGRSGIIQLSDNIVNATTQLAAEATAGQSGEEERRRRSSLDTGRTSCHRNRASRPVEPSSDRDVATGSTSSASTTSTFTSAGRPRDDVCTVSKQKQHQQQVSVLRVYGRWRPSSLGSVRKRATNLRDPRESTRWKDQSFCLETRRRRRARSL